MTVTDPVRVVAIVSAAATYGLAAANLVISPRRFTWRSFAGSGGGFIWLHIVCVTVPFQGFVTWGVVEVEQRIGGPLTWRPWALMFLCLLISVGYVIIYRIELARLRLQRAVTAP